MSVTKFASVVLAIGFCHRSNTGMCLLGLWFLWHVNCILPLSWKLNKDEVRKISIVKNL